MPPLSFNAHRRRIPRTGYRGNISGLYSFCRIGRNRRFSTVSLGFLRFFTVFAGRSANRLPWRPWATARAGTPAARWEPGVTRAPGGLHPSGEEPRFPGREQAREQADRGSSAKGRLILVNVFFTASRYGRPACLLAITPAGFGVGGRPTGLPGPVRAAAGVPVYGIFTLP